MLEAEKLEELREMAQKATPGPWVADRNVGKKGCVIYAVLPLNECKLPQDKALSAKDPRDALAQALRHYQQDGQESGKDRQITHLDKKAHHLGMLCAAVYDCKYCYFQGECKRPGDACSWLYAAQEEINKGVNMDQKIKELEDYAIWPENNK